MRNVTRGSSGECQGYGLCPRYFSLSMSTSASACSQTIVTWGEPSGFSVARCQKFFPSSAFRTSSVSVAIPSSLSTLCLTAPIAVREGSQIVLEGLMSSLGGVDLAPQSADLGQTLLTLRFGVRGLVLDQPSFGVLAEQLDLLCRGRAGEGSSDELDVLLGHA